MDQQWYCIYPEPDTTNGLAPDPDIPTAEEVQELHDVERNAMYMPTSIISIANEERNAFLKAGTRPDTKSKLRIEQLEHTVARLTETSQKRKYETAVAVTYAASLHQTLTEALARIKELEVHLEQLELPVPHGASTKLQEEGQQILDNIPQPIATLVETALATAATKTEAYAQAQAHAKALEYAAAAGMKRGKRTKPRSSSLADSTRNFNRKHTHDDFGARKIDRSVLGGDIEDPQALDAGLELLSSLSQVLPPTLQTRTSLSGTTEELPGAGGGLGTPKVVTGLVSPTARSETSGSSFRLTGSVGVSALAPSLLLPEPDPSLVPVTVNAAWLPPSQPVIGEGESLAYELPEASQSTSLVSPQLRSATSGPAPQMPAFRVPTPATQTTITATPAVASMASLMPPGFVPSNARGSLSSASTSSSLSASTTQGLSLPQPPQLTATASLTSSNPSLVPATQLKATPAKPTSVNSAQIASHFPIISTPSTATPTPKPIVSQTPLPTGSKVNVISLSTPASSSPITPPIVLPATAGSPATSTLPASITSSSVIRGTSSGVNITASAVAANLPTTAAMPNLPSSLLPGSSTLAYTTNSASQLSTGTKTSAASAAEVLTKLGVALTGPLAALANPINASSTTTSSATAMGSTSLPVSVGAPVHLPTSVSTTQANLSSTEASSRSFTTSGMQSHLPVPPVVSTVNTSLPAK